MDSAGDRGGVSRRLGLAVARDAAAAGPGSLVRRRGAASACRPGWASPREPGAGAIEWNDVRGRPHRLGGGPRALRVNRARPAEGDHVTSCRSRHLPDHDTAGRIPLALCRREQRQQHRAGEQHGMCGKAHGQEHRGKDAVPGPVRACACHGGRDRGTINRPLPVTDAAGAMRRRAAHTAAERLRGGPAGPHSHDSRPAA